jgi:4-hydroxybenzoate polyprenyltransferase
MTLTAPPASSTSTRDHDSTQLAAFTERIVGRLPPALRAMRPQQWTKNGLVVLALLFARRLMDLRADGRVILAFIAFSLAASFIYVINDIADRERDRLHPTKRLRPIASGQLSLVGASITAGICCVGTGVLGVGLALTSPPLTRDPFGEFLGSGILFCIVLAAYMGMNLLYTFWLKHLVLWDVFVIASGFVLRAFAGALAIPVPISPWFYLCTLFLAIFLALGKRRAELVLLEDQAVNHRANLQSYNLVLLDQLMSVVVTSTLITYSLYTFQADIEGFALMATIPFVIFGIFRYLYLIYVKHEGDRPDEILLRDRQILASVVLCILMIIGILYGLPALRHH